MAHARLSLLDSIKNHQLVDFAEFKPEDFKQQDEAGMTPLMHAIRLSDRMALVHLLEIKEDKWLNDPGIQIEDQKGMTALMHAAACTQADAKDLNGPVARRDDINELLILRVLLQSKSPVDFEQTIPVIVEHSNVNFFKCLMSELEKHFPIKDNQLPDTLVPFINQFLQVSNIKNRGIVLGYILQQPWAVSLKKHESNKNLVLDAVQMRSSNTVCILLENDFPLPDAKPSVLTQILQQNFYTRDEKGLVPDRDQKMKQEVIKVFAKKHPRLLTNWDLKEALVDKNLLKVVIESFTQVFHFDQLIEAWNYDFKAVVDFCIEAGFVNYTGIFKENLSDRVSYTFFYRENERKNILNQFRMLIREGMLITGWQVNNGLYCKDESLIKTLEELITVNHCVVDKKNNYEMNFNPASVYYQEKIWKYPKILYCMIKAGHEKIMDYRYGLLNRDAWYLVFEGYQENIKQKKPNAQAEILALVQAAAEAKPSQLTISDEAFERAMATGDEKLVALLIQHGAKVKTEYSLVSDSALEQAAKRGHFQLVKTLLFCSKTLFPAAVIKAAAQCFFNDSRAHSYLKAVHCAAVAAECGKFDGAAFKGHFLRIFQKDLEYELLNLLISRYGCQRKNLFDAIYSGYEHEFDKASSEYDQYCQSLAKQDKSAEVKLVEVKSAAVEKKDQIVELKAPDNNDPLPALRIELLRACKEGDEKKQQSHQQLIAEILKCKKTEEKLVEFEHIISPMVENKKISFFNSLMIELEKIFPIKKDQLPDSLLHFIHRILRISIIQNSNSFIEHIVKQPWSASVKKHDANKNLVLEAIKARSAIAAVRLIENDFPMTESKPSILSHILQHAFFNWGLGADGSWGLLEDNDLIAKNGLIRAFAKKFPRLLTKEDLKTALLDKNLLKYVIVEFPTGFRFNELLNAWNYNFNELVDFWIKKELNISFYDSAWNLDSLGSYLFLTREKDRDNILAGFEKLLNNGVILTSYTFTYSLKCEDTRLIQLMNNTVTVQHCSAYNKDYYSKYFFNPAGFSGNENNLKFNNYNEKIWKYPKILSCMIKAGSEKIMCYDYSSGFGRRDAWSLVFENANNQEHLIDLVNAAAEAKPSQLIISDEAFDRALATGNEKLVALLIQHGAKVKTESKLLSPSTLEKSAKWGHFNVVKMLLMLPHIKWPVKTLQAACEVSQGDIKSYLMIVASYENLAIVPDRFPGDVAAQCELLHLLITKHGFNKEHLKQYEYRFHGLAEEYEKRYVKSPQQLGKKADAHAPNAPAFLEEAKPVVIQKDEDLEDGMNPQAHVEVVLPNPIPAKASTPPSAPPLELVKVAEIQPAQVSEHKVPRHATPPQLMQPVVEAKKAEVDVKAQAAANPKAEGAEAQVEGSPRREVLELQEEGSPKRVVIEVQVEGNAEQKVIQAQTERNAKQNVIQVQAEGNAEQKKIQVQANGSPRNGIGQAQIERSLKPILQTPQPEENRIVNGVDLPPAPLNLHLQLIEDQQEGQPHRVPAVPQQPAANGESKNATQLEGQAQVSPMPMPVKEQKQCDLSFFARRNQIQNEKMAEAACMLSLMIKGSDDRDNWQHLLLGLDQFFKVKTQSLSPSPQP